MPASELRRPIKSSTVSGKASHITGEGPGRALKDASDDTGQTNSADTGNDPRHDLTRRG
jgi:hypothetical protein